MKKQGNHSQLKDEEHSPERTNNKADLFTVIVTDLKKEILKTLTKLGKAIVRNTE